MDSRIVPIQLRVAGIPEVVELSRKFKPKYIISLLDPDKHRNPDFSSIAKQFKFFMEDTDILFDKGAPRLEMVKEILNLAKHFHYKDTILVHCHAGISRSTAVALGILRQYGYNTFDALEYVLDVRPLAIPNRLILAFVDKILGTHLQQICDQWKTYSQGIWTEIFDANEEGLSPLDVVGILDRQLELFRRFKSEFPQK